MRFVVLFGSVLRLPAQASDPGVLLAQGKQFAAGAS
jgi:hypothetical protein